MRKLTDSFLNSRYAVNAEIVIGRATLQERDSLPSESYSDLAERFGTLSQLFRQLSSPNATQELINSLVAGDAEAFGRIIDGVKFPTLGKCFWVWEVIERVISTPTGFVEECSLRNDLTPAEWGLYLSIAFRHRHMQPVAKTMEVTLEVHDGRHIIPPGAFLDELKANGLVECALRMTYDTSTTLLPGKPERLCV